MFWFRYLIFRATISIQQMLIYRLSSILTVVFGVIIIFAEYLAIEIYYEFNNEIGGWSKYGFYILFGSFNSMVVLYNFLFEIGHDEFAIKLKYGELDYDMIRPIDSMLLTSCSRFDYPSLLNLVIPIIFIHNGSSIEKISWGLFNSSIFVLFIFLGVFIIYLLNQILMTAAFWLTDFSNAFQLIGAITNLGSKPFKIYPWYMQLIFGFCIPIILAGNLPADLLLGNLTIQKVMFTILGCMTLFIMTRIFWNLGLKKYSSASS